MMERPEPREPATSEHAPLYARVKRRIADDLLASVGSGQLLPSERELAEQLGVSRVTLRRALTELESDGLVASSPGRGWYGTADVIGEPPNTLLSFTELGRQSGLEASSTVLTAEPRAATLDEADELGVAPGASLFHLRRVRQLDGVPTALDDSLVPVSIAPGIADVDFAEASLYSTLETRFGVRIARADYAVEAIAADGAIATHLSIEPGKPILRAHQTTYDEAGEKIERGTTVYRGDRYRFRASLTRAIRSAR